MSALLPSAAHASFSVPTGGLLLEAFLCMGASFVARRKWTRLKASMGLNPGGGVENDLNELVGSVGNDFYFHVLSLLASRGTSAKVQLFHLSPFHLPLFHWQFFRLSLFLDVGDSSSSSSEELSPSSSKFAFACGALPFSFMNHFYPTWIATKYYCRPKHGLDHTYRC